LQELIFDEVVGLLFFWGIKRNDHHHHGKFRSIIFGCRAPVKLSESQPPALR